MSQDCECVMKERLDALEKSLDDSNKSHSNTHEKMFDRIRHLETENAVQNANTQAIKDMLQKMDAKNDKMVEKVDSIEKCTTAQLQTISELNERGKKNQARLDALEAKPGKKWEDASSTLRASIIGGVGTLIVTGIIAILAFASGLLQIGG